MKIIKNRLWLLLIFVLSFASISNFAQAAATEKSEDSITKFYCFQGVSALLLAVPKHEFMISDADVDDVRNEGLIDTEKLQHIFKENSLITTSFTGALVRWKDKEWNEAAIALIARANKTEKIIWKIQKRVQVDEVPDLLQNAKTILKLFLINSTPGSLKASNFIIKERVCRRLFTYAKLKKVIEYYGLSHIHLPQKYLVIKDIKHNRDITDTSEASSIIDRTFKVGVIGSEMLDVRFDFDPSSGYEYKVFAQKKERSTAPLSQAAMADLKVLITHAPFDVGNDNIFTDSNGDAWIIDTENTGEPAQSCLQKLVSRYKVADAGA